MRSRGPKTPSPTVATTPPHFDKRMRQRRLTLQDVKFAVRRAARCEPYPDGTPLDGGTCWCLHGPSPDEDDPDLIRVGVEAYFDTHDGKRVLLVTLVLRCPMNAMRCPACRDGELVPIELEDHEMGPWLGLESVRVERVPALRCDACEGVTFDGAVLDAVLRATARLLVRQAGDLWPAEARFLRKFLAATQTELATRLGVDRTTVTRWETGQEPIGRANAVSLRAHVALHLAGLDPASAEELDRELAHALPRALPPGRYVVPPPAPRRPAFAKP